MCKKNWTDLIIEWINNVLHVVFFNYYGTTNTDRIRNIFRELIFYIIFVILATIVISSNISNYWFTHIMKNEFIDDEFDTMYPSPISLLGVRNFEEVWKAIENLLFESIYWDRWYNKPNLTRHERVKLYLLGAPRIRQIRVKKHNCNNEKVKRSHKHCYYSFSNSDIETGDFGLNNDSFWKYKKNAALYPYKGLIQTYGRHGYYFDFPLDERIAWNHLHFMKKNLWIDRQTRVVFVDFTIYNANVNVFLIVKVAFEVPPTGSIVLSYKLHNVKLIALVEPYEFIILGLEIMCILYLLYYTICLILSIKKDKWIYFTSSWNMLDITLIILGYTYFIVCLYSSILAKRTLEEALLFSSYCTSFDKVGYFFDQQDTILSIFMLLMYLKLFKYVDLSSRVGLLNHTIKKSFHDLPAFTCVFFIVFLNFSFVGYYLFGSRVFDFSTIDMTMFTLIKALSGEFNYFDLESHYQYAGAIYFIAFILIVFFIFLNMFLGIISDAYITIKNSMKNHDDNEISNFLYRGARKSCKNSKCCQNIFKNILKPDPFYRLRNILESSYYDRHELDLFLKNYELKKDLTEEEDTAFKEELAMFHKQLFESYEYVKMIDDLSTYISEDKVELFEEQLKNLEKKVLTLVTILPILYDRITNSQLVEEKAKEKRSTVTSSMTQSEMNFR